MSGERILVVDDEKVVCSALSRELSSHGYIVDSAFSGEEALEKVSTTKYSLIYLDMVLPGMDGVETCKAIKDVCPEANVVCFTGVIDNNLIDKEAAFQNAGGKIFYLYKPFTENELLAVTQKALEVS